MIIDEEHAQKHVFPMLFTTEIEHLNDVFRSKQAATMVAGYLSDFLEGLNRWASDGL